MVTRIRPALGAGLITTLALGVAAPVLGAFEAVEPNPLRSGSTIRLADVAAFGDVAAIGWREGSGQGQLRFALSTNRGASFERDNGNLRSFPVLGLNRMGMALDICGGSVWVGTIARHPLDPGTKDSDVVISRRGANGVGGSQVFVTAPNAPRKIRAVDIACIGSRFLAIAYIEHTGDTSRARLLLRDLEGLAPPPPAVTNSLHSLGEAGPHDGISVAAIGGHVFVSWSSGGRRNLQLKRFDIGSGADPTITPRPTQKFAHKDAILPKLAARGKKVVLAYTDDGKVKVRTSDDSGASFSAATTLLNAGTVAIPSRATSAALSGSRVVIEAFKKLPNGADRSHAPVRLESTDLGGGWSESTEFGNRGPRMAALRKVDNSASRIIESWHDDGASTDVLRAQREVAGS